MSRGHTEHDPLLPQKPRPGPLDLPRSTRYAILGGVWLATLLAVSTNLSTFCAFDNLLTMCLQSVNCKI